MSCGSSGRVRVRLRLGSLWGVQSSSSQTSCSWWDTSAEPHLGGSPEVLNQHSFAGELLVHLPLKRHPCVSFRLAELLPDVPRDSLLYVAIAKNALEAAAGGSEEALVEVNDYASTLKAIKRRIEGDVSPSLWFLP